MPDVHTSDIEAFRKLEDRLAGLQFLPDDLRALARQAESEGFEITLNLHVPMDRAEDRMVSLLLSHGPDLATVEPVHLKVALFESVVTSFGIVLRRPERRWSGRKVRPARN